MSVWAKKWAYEQHPKRVEDEQLTDKKHPAAKSVLVALAEYPGVGQRSCWPSQKTLADMTDMSDRQVRRCLADLEFQVLIRRTERRREDGTRRSDTVTLLGPIEAFGPPQDGEGDQPDERSGSQGTNRTRMSDQPDESSGHEPSLEPSGVEANASSGKPQSVGLEKYIVDEIYRTMKEAGKRLPNTEYTFHLGRAQDMLEKDNPTDDELENLPAAFLRTWTIKSRCDAPLALVEMRRQKDRTELLSQPSEAPSFYDKQVSAHDKARSPIWYASVYEADFATVEGWIKEGCGHEEIEQRLAEGVA